MLTMLAPPDVVEVIPGLLIGSAPRHRHRRALASSGVTHVFDLRAESPRDFSEWPSGVTVICAPIERTVAPAVGCLAELSLVVSDALDASQRVLVHCRYGGGLTGMVTCAVLMQRRCSLPDAESVIRALRPRAVPDRTQLKALGILEQKLWGPVPLAAS